MPKNCVFRFQNSFNHYKSAISINFLSCWTNRFLSCWLSHSLSFSEESFSGSSFLVKISWTKSYSNIENMLLLLLYECQMTEAIRAKNIKKMLSSFSGLFLQSSKKHLSRRRHDMGNSLGNDTSCESSTPLRYSTLNVLAPNDQWILRKTPLKFYCQLIYY